MAKRSFSAPALLAVFLVLPACSTHRAVKHDFDNSRTFAADFDQTWAAVMESAADLVLPIEKISRDSGLVTLQWIKIPRAWVDCFGQPPGPGTSQAAYLFNVFVRRESDTRTRVTVNSFIARPDVPVDYSQCYSTGAFEGLFFATIEEKLRPSKGRGGSGPDTGEAGSTGDADDARFPATYFMSNHPAG